MWSGTYLSFFFFLPYLMAGRSGRIKVLLFCECSSQLNIFKKEQLIRAPNLLRCLCQSTGFNSWLRLQTPTSWSKLWESAVRTLKDFLPPTSKSSTFDSCLTALWKWIGTGECSFFFLSVCWSHIFTWYREIYNMLNLFNK